jgi:transposase InsO family protein
MAASNPLWGAPRVHGELLKLGIEISERTVSRWMPKRRQPPSQNWRTFLDNHVGELVSIDFLTVPTAAFRVLFVLIVLAHDRRKIVHFNVTEHPTAKRTARQLIQTFYDRKPPRYLIRDRDGVYGLLFEDQLRALEIEEVVIAPRSPWQSPYVERVIGTLRRECLDHFVVLSENYLRQIVRQFLTYYHETRTRLALDKDAPEHRSVQPAESGTVIERICFTMMSEFTFLRARSCWRSAPGVPVMIVKYDGHASILGGEMLKRLPARVARLRGYDAVTGQLKQEAFFAASKFATRSMSAPRLVRAMIRAVDELAQHGIGLIHTAEGVGFPRDLDVDLVRFLARGFRNTNRRARLLSDHGC